MRLPKDPRILQISFLGSFLVLGIFLHDFDMPLWLPAVIIASACAAQWACVRLYRLAPQGYRSPTITALGTAVLLRADVWWIPPLFAAIAIALKFVVRRNGRHLFNPTNSALALAILATHHAWCSPSQWGESAGVLAWFAVLGCAVVNRAFRSDVSFTFLGAWVLLKAARVLYLGQEPSVLLHQLSVGSLIIFTFFMISDPKTTPSHRVGRMAMAVFVAGLGFYFQQGLFWTNGLVWALFLTTPFVPFVDRLFPAERFEWPGAPVRVASAA